MNCCKIGCRLSGLLQNVHSFYVSLLNRQIYGGKPSHIPNLPVSAVADKELSQIIPAEHHCKHQGSAAVPMLKVEISAMGDQHFRNFGVSFKRNAHQSGISPGICEVNCCSCFK